MLTEKGSLPVGIEYAGKVHREFEIRPQLVRDSIDAVEEDRARNNDSYLGLSVLAKQMIRLGDIPPAEITPDLLLGLYDVDLAAIQKASGRLQSRLLSFRGANEGAAANSSGAGETGGSLA